MQNRKIAFIDRDGTIVKEPPDFQIDRLEKISFVEHVIPALLSLQEMGYELVMVTNQDGLGTSSFLQQDFDLCHDFIIQVLASQGVHFNRIAVCPHFESDQCECRKPRVGLVLPEIRSGIDFKRSFVVGDRDSDVQLAQNLGIKSFKTGQLTWPEIIRTIKSEGRLGKVSRKTKETEIKVGVQLDGEGLAKIKTGQAFFDHMLEQIARHSGCDLTIEATGDLEIDEHHTVEDVALALGQCLREALGEKRGIERYGFVLPMDDAKVEMSLDLSGRPYFVFEGEYPREEVGGLSTEMVIHFFRSLSESLQANLHLKVQGLNTHHMVEASFKAFARSFRQAIQQTAGVRLPSTKESL